ncbi:MAG: hypothetical protein ABFC97_06815 [Anaerolineaceae bacterium]
MTEQKTSLTNGPFTQYAPFAGAILIISGFLLLLDQKLNTGWLSFSIPVFIGLVMLGFGIFRKSIWWIIAALILTAVGLTLFFLFSSFLVVNLSQKFGFALLINFVLWICIFALISLRAKKNGWWTLFISFTCAALSYIFLFNRTHFLDYVFYISIAIGLVFLIWGYKSAKIGLIIPGVLLPTIGAGVYYGWSNPQMPGGLQKTGIMLVWFALGWGLITVFSRIIDRKFIWWPLIPGGILLTVGSGLYIGGDPENALGFISNTGSVGLILIGAYLIFLKYGIKH